VESAFYYQKTANGPALDLREGEVAAETTGFIEAISPMEMLSTTLLPYSEPLGWHPLVISAALEVLIWVHVQEMKRFFPPSPAAAKSISLGEDSPC